MQFKSLQIQYEQILKQIENYEGDLNSESYIHRLNSLKILASTVFNIWFDLTENGIELPALEKLQIEIDWAKARYC